MCFKDLTTAKARVEYLRTKIAVDDKWALRALLVIWGAHKGTMVKDGVGFTQPDADFGCKMAQQWSNQRRLSERQLSAVRKMMVKYSAQLVKEFLK